jgi:hypothetical protein
MKKIRLTESELITLIKRVIKEDNLWSRMFGKPDIDDASHTSLRGKGYSHTVKDEDDKRSIVFGGQKFSQEDIEFADYNDLGDLPRIENGKLIIANPAWSL